MDSKDKLTADLCYSLMTKDYISVIDHLKAGADPLKKLQSYIYDYPINICLINDDFYSLLAVLTSIVVSNISNKFLSMKLSRTELEKLTRLKYRLSDGGYSEFNAGFRGDVYNLINEKIDTYFNDNMIATEDSDSDTDSDSDSDDCSELSE